MTVNALLSYLCVTLLLAAAVFFAVGIAKQRLRKPVSKGEAPVADKALLAPHHADLVCGTILLILALIAEIVSLARGGPASGESSGNTAGGAVAIFLVSSFCVLVCVVVRQLLLLRQRRKLDA